MSTTEILRRDRERRDRKAAERERRRARRALRLLEVLDRTGLKKTALFDAVKRGIFPKPFVLLPGGRAVAWDEEEVDDFLCERMAQRAEEFRMQHMEEVD
jgi:prophage regulatory protein